MGLILLIGGAELLVRGAAGLALAAGVSALVVGLTVVAFCTSAPELFVSVQSAMRSADGADIAIGNVVGSNITNILLILGASTAIVPIAVTLRLIRIDILLMIAVSFLLPVVGFDGTIGRLEGLALVALLIGYMAFTYHAAKREKKAAEMAGKIVEGYEKKKGATTVVYLVPIVVGLALLVGGSKLMVDSAVKIAQGLGVSDLVIGVTIVAFGTSVPELATSVMACLKGERDMAVGNIVGSNIFNILCVLGLSALVGVGGVRVSTEALTLHIPIMIAVAWVCLPICYTGLRIARWEGGLLLAYYAVYIAYSYLSAVQAPGLPVFERFMIWFALPASVVALCAGLALDLWRKTRQGQGGK